MLLGEIQNLVEKKMDFAFETTLSEKSYAAFLRKQKARDYSIHLFFLWIPTVELAIGRIKDRVASGGHDVELQVYYSRFWKFNRRRWQVDTGADKRIRARI